MFCKCHFDIMDIQSKISFVLCLLFIPTDTERSNIEARDEKTFPNGTIFGTYTYVDTQGNHVDVKYFADANSYSIILKGSQLPGKDSQNPKNAIPGYDVTTSPDLATVLMDTMVPLKLDLPEIGKMYTIENPHNATNEDAKRKSWAESDEKDDQPIDYDTFDPALHTSKSKTHEKERGYKKFIRKIRQILDGYKLKLPST